jgi:hypothetical protein
VIVVPLHVYKEMGIIQSAGVEVRGLKAGAITRRKNLSKPVLEKYVFTPNVEPVHIDLDAALRVCTHILLENKLDIQVKVVELHNQGTKPLSPDVALILADLPLLKASGLQSNLGYWLFFKLILYTFHLNIHHYQT